MRRPRARHPRLACCLLPAAAGPAQLDPAPAQRPPHPLADRRPARPGDLHALRGAPPQARARRRRHPRLLETGRRPDRRRTAAGDARRDRRAAGLLRRLRLLLHRTDHRRQLPHRSRVGRRPAPARQELPLGHDRADRHRRRPNRPKCEPCAERRRRGRRRRGGLRPGRRGPAGHPVQATLEPNPYSTEAFDLVEPIREAATRSRPGRSSAGPARSNSTSATPPPATRS